MRFQFISDHARRWPIDVQCRDLGVTKRGYRAWRKRRREGVISRRQRENFVLLLHIQAAFKQGREVYGSPRVWGLLRAEGHTVGKHRVARLMRQNGLRGVRRGRRKPQTTQSHHRLPVAQNLLNRQFEPRQIGGVDRVWCCDITCLPASIGWIYLAVVLDAYSRRVVGWEISHLMETSIVSGALDKAMTTRGDAMHDEQRLFHSDRGSQFASKLFGKKLQDHGFTASMSRKANCWDNALVESFFGSLKSELVERLPGRKFDNLDEAYRLTADYIENFYNRVRLHSTLGYKSPVAFELAHRVETISAN